jgi:hypothetical protein
MQVAQVEDKAELIMNGWYGVIYLNNINILRMRDMVDGLQLIFVLFP